MKELIERWNPSDTISSQRANYPEPTIWSKHFHREIDELEVHSIHSLAVH